MLVADLRLRNIWPKCMYLPGPKIKGGEENRPIDNRICGRWPHPQHECLGLSSKNLLKLIV